MYYRVRTKLIIEENNNNNNSSQIRQNNNNIRRINNKHTTTTNNNINTHHYQRKAMRGVNPGSIMEHLNEANKTNNTGDEARGRHHTPGGTLRTPLPPPLVS